MHLVRIVVAKTGECYGLEKKCRRKREYKEVESNRLLTRESKAEEFFAGDNQATEESIAVN